MKKISIIVVIMFFASTLWITPLTNAEPNVKPAITFSQKDSPELRIQDMLMNFLNPYIE